jgi:phosphate transport system permease protein
MPCKYKIYKQIFAIVSFLAMFFVYILLGFVLYKGFSFISFELIFSDTKPIDAILLKQRVFDGIFPAIVGTFMLIILALSFSLIFGFASGIYLSIYAKNSTRKIVNLCFELLASVPSILIGLFFLLLSIHLHERFQANFMPSLLLSSMALGILIMPYLVQNTRISLDNIPKNIKQIGLNLGLTPTQNLLKVLLPYCSKELLSGIFLSLGRACEDTAVIMLTGAVASAGIASSIFNRFEALPFYIYYLSTNYADDKELSQAFAASLILLLIALFLFLLTKIIQKKFRSHYGYN